VSSLFEQYWDRAAEIWESARRHLGLGRERSFAQRFLPCKKLERDSSSVLSKTKEKVKEKQKKQTNKKKNDETREINERKFLKNLRIVYTSCRWLGPRKFELRIQKKVFLPFSSSLSLSFYICDTISSFFIFSLSFYICATISSFLVLSLSFYVLQVYFSLSLYFFWSSVVILISKSFFNIVLCFLHFTKFIHSSQCLFIPLYVCSFFPLFVHFYLRYICCLFALFVHTSIFMILS
jgi:hypothetical protein